MARGFFRRPLLRRQMAQQSGVVPLFLLKLPLRKRHLLLQAAFALLGHGQLRLWSFGGTRRVVVQHHVNPVPPAARVPFG